MSAHDEGDLVSVPRAELARLRAIEEAAAWHLNHSACAGWQQGEVLALALGVNPEALNQAFARLLDTLGIPHDGPDPLAALLDDTEETR